MFRSLSILVIFLSMFQTVSAEIKVRKQIEYATVDGQKLFLDLYLPTDMHSPPVVVWIHGGAWRSGSKDSVPILQLVEHGYAIASVDYRLSPVATFPAQIHDIKAALRYLRAHAQNYSCDTTSITVAGSSAGGHLAALVGVTNGVKELEGTVGEHLNQSSSVQGIIDFYGPTNFLTILKQSTPHGLGVRVPALQLLMGSQPEENNALAKLASPVFHVSADDPPLLIFHGDQDPQVPINQSHELHAKYKELKLPVQFEVIHGGAHGGKSFYDQNRIHQILHFLKSIKPANF